MTSDLEFPSSNEVFRNQILHQHQVVPLVPELAVLLVDADLFPSRPLAELAARIVVSHDASHQFVIAFVARRVLHGFHQLLPHAVPAQAAVDIDRKLGDATVTGARAVRRERGPAEHGVLDRGHQHRVLLRTRYQPQVALLRRGVGVLEGRRAVLHALVVNPGDLLGVVGARRPYLDRFGPFGHWSPCNITTGILSGRVRQSNPGTLKSMRFGTWTLRLKRAY